MWKQKEARKGIMPSNLLKAIFDTLPESVIACDGEGKILRINAAAMKLFEMASESLGRGMFYHQFLQHYKMGEEQQRAISLERWLMRLILDGEGVSGLLEETIVLHVPSGRKLYINMCSVPLLDAQQRAEGTLYICYDITHRYQKALHLQRVHQAVLTLTEAIARIPEHMNFVFPEGTFLLSPPVLFVAQQLVDMLRHVLDCHTVILLAFGPRAGHLHYAVGSGFTSEQEQHRREMSGHFLPSDFVDATVLARLSAKKEAILPANRLRLPPGFQADFGFENFLLIPMFLEQRLAGVLVIAKAGSDSGYTTEEIKLVKAVTAQSVLLISCLHCLYEQTETRARALMRQEMKRLVNEFLNLASHELNTPLTAIKGNIQLAQRRFATLKRQMAQQPEQVNENIEQTQHLLASAAQHARLQERMIKDLIDGARIQANSLELPMRRCDLIALLSAAVADQQSSAPGRLIVLDIVPTQKVVPIIADIDRIVQVINSYLANALSYSPTDQPVTVQLAVEDAVARVSVHDEGPGISQQEKGRIWERLYLCRALIERHHGSVGVQSKPGQGTTFWFSLPIEGSPTE